MKYTAEIDVMPLKELLDPQGKAVAHGLHNMNFKEVEDVRIGKHIVMHLDADSEQAARTRVEDACKKLLANPVMEYFVFDIKSD